ncbi:MAG: hypothetical protein J1E98_08645 [Lachnospiraceae bacterium]|nr:hypothetical protein [Lachnospiraceae bacterium]
MKKGNFRKALFSTLVMVAVVLLFLTGTYLLVTSKGDTGKDDAQEMDAAEQEEAPREQEDRQAPEQFLHAFAEVLYSYDTRERRFYEGTEAFMTPQAYAELKPASAEELTESGEEIPAVVSSLQETRCYYSYLSESEAEVIMESRFTLSRSGNGQILQYVKLGIEEQENGWKITGINVLDTLEQ